jgi:hypothetical protein
VSRHRSPAGRHAHPRSAPQAATIPGAWPRRADAPPAPEAARPGGTVGVLERPAAVPAGRTGEGTDQPRRPATPHHEPADRPREPATAHPESADRPRESAGQDREFAAYALEWADRLGASADRPGTPTGGRRRAQSGRAAAPALAPRVGPRHASTPAVRNGLMAAAATAGLLSVAAPMAPVLPGPADGATTLALAADGRPAADAPEAAATAEAPAAVVADLVDGRLLAASILPVLATADPLPPEADAASLLKAAGLADIARAAEEQRLAREAAANCDAPLRGLGSVKDHVRGAARFLSCLYDRPTLIGVASRARVSDHPRGLAVDFMTGREQGDLIADCALANQEALGISYVIWRQRVNYGGGWEPMSDRGGATQNHYDHVHVSFERGGGSGDPLAALCT